MYTAKVAVGHVASFDTGASQMQISVAIELSMGPMILWKHQNRSGDLLGPNCLRGPLFSFAVKPLYTDTRCVTALHSYTALYSAIHYTAIQPIHRYTLYNLYNIPLIFLRTGFVCTCVVRVVCSHKYVHK